MKRTMIMAQREAVFPSIDGRHIEGDTFGDSGCRARDTHIQFRRFSGCPICNTHIAALRRETRSLMPWAYTRFCFSTR